MAQDDIRARRAERVKQDKMKNFLPMYGKYILIAVILIAAIGAAATFYKPPPVKKFAHEHPAFSIFADGEQVTFNHQDYDASRISDKVHFHIRGPLQDASTWHVEAMFPGGIPDLSLSQIFGQYGVTFAKGRMKLDTKDGHTGQEYADAGNKTWHLYVSKMTAGEERQPFVEVTAGSALLPEGAARTNGDYSAYVPRDLDKMLLHYGPADAATIAAQQAQVPDPKP